MAYSYLLLLNLCVMLSWVPVVCLPEVLQYFGVIMLLLIHC